VPVQLLGYPLASRHEFTLRTIARPQDCDGPGYRQTRRMGRDLHRQPGQHHWRDSQQQHGPGQRRRVDADHRRDREELGSARKQQPRGESVNERAADLSRPSTSVAGDRAEIYYGP
jgi:hypothetical protein